MHYTPEHRARGLGAAARASALSLALAWLVVGSVAHAHIVYGDRPLQAFVAEAELVLHAKIAAVHDDVAARKSPGASGRPFVEAKVLERIKGPESGERVRFVQHGHGVAQFSAGDEVVLFLIPVSRSRELDTLATPEASGAIEWVSLQEHDDAYRFGEIDGPIALDAVRSYAAAENAGTEGERLGLLRRANFGLLESGDARLAASVLQMLAADPRAPWLTAADAPRLVAQIENPATPVGIRIGLLTELGRRGMLKGTTHWLALLADDSPQTDRVVAIRAAGQVRDPVVRARLFELVGSSDAQIAATSARSLGGSRDPAAVPALVGALGRDEAPVRLAAIRGLGQIGSTEAFAALEQAAESHADPATRRHAQAELRARGGREAS